MSLLLSLVMPCYNEEAVIQQSIDTIMQKMEEFSIDKYEIICVDDGSKDLTLPILQVYAEKHPQIKIVSFSANRGQQMAFFAGMCYASGQAVVLMDADLQDPPECIPRMLSLWKEGFQVVYGRRKVRDGESIFKRLSAYLFYRLLNTMSFTEIPQDVGEFRLMDRAVVDIVIKCPETKRFNRALVSWLGFKQTEILFERPERLAGETKFGIKEMIQLAKDGLFSFSYAPIVFTQYLGIGAMFASGIISLYAIYSYFFGSFAPGWTSLIIVQVFFSGAILFALGIIGEYIARIHTESLGRPLFIPAKTVNLKDKKVPDSIARFINADNPELQ
ncbi:MAG: glycosyltransferase family 2 protein [Brevinema sp.]